MGCRQVHSGDTRKRGDFSPDQGPSHLHGILYKDTLDAPLEVGQTLRGFVRNVRPDRKIDLSLDASGYKRVAGLRNRASDG